jgi:predicted negative regulator of RcsB-dependent stress response
MASKVSRKKLLREPDEFLSFSGKALQWSRENLRVILYAAAGVTAAVVAVVGFWAWLEHREIQGAEAMAQAFGEYTRAVEGQAGPEELAQARRQLDQVVQEYGSTPAGLQARLALGDLLLEKGSYAEAEKLLAGLAEESDAPPEIIALAWHGLGVAREGQQRFSQAAQAYARARELAGPALAAMYLLDQARALEGAGQKARAAQLYREVLDQQEDSERRLQARARLVALGEDPGGK